jgi:hypothetical protein
MRRRVLSIRGRILLLACAIAVWLTNPLLAQKPGQSAGDFYLSYVAAAEKMTSISEVLSFMPASQAAMMSKLPKDKEPAMIKDIKKELVTGVKVLKETPDKDGVMLTLEGSMSGQKQRVKGWAKIIKEGGAWKLERDDWSGTAPPSK